MHNDIDHDFRCFGSTPCPDRRGSQQRCGIATPRGPSAFQGHTRRRSFQQERNVSKHGSLKLQIKYISLLCVPLNCLLTPSLHFSYYTYIVEYTLSNHAHFIMFQHFKIGSVLHTNTYTFCKRLILLLDLFQYFKNSVIHVDIYFILFPKLSLNLYTQMAILIEEMFKKCSKKQMRVKFQGTMAQ